MVGDPDEMVAELQRKTECVLHVLRVPPGSAGFDEDTASSLQEEAAEEQADGAARAKPTPATHETIVHLKAGEMCVRHHLGVKQGRTHSTVVKPACNNTFCIDFSPSMERVEWVAGLGQGAEPSAEILEAALQPRALTDGDPGARLQTGLDPADAHAG